MPNMFKRRIKREELLKMWLKEERHNQCGLGLRIFVKA
jgi:hypothetical protein